MIKKNKSYNKNFSYKIFLVSGGTGGHSFPARALADSFITHGYAPHIICEQRGFDYFKHYFGQTSSARLYKIPLKSPQGGIGKKIISLLSLLLAIYPLIKLFRLEKPDILIGFGGYMMVPSFLAARWLGIRHIFLEQNMVMGRANRLFASSASAIATGLPQCRGILKKQQNKTYFVGTPIKQEFLQKKPKRKFTNHPISLLITGGSQGARSFATILPKAIEKAMAISSYKNITIQQQANPDQLVYLQKTYKKMAIKHDVREFFYDVPKKLANADIFIGRAGASTIAEISAMAMPSILIPFPFATDNHQYYNAKWLCDKQSCRLVVEPKTSNLKLYDAVSDSLAMHIVDLINSPAKRRQLSHRIGYFAKKNASFELMKLAISTIEKTSIK